MTLPRKDVLEDSIFSGNGVNEKVVRSRKSDGNAAIPNDAVLAAVNVIF